MRLRLKDWLVCTHLRLWIYRVVSDIQKFDDLWFGELLNDALAR